MTITQLQVFQDRTVILHLMDGEVLKAKIAFVDLEYEDIIVDVMETSKIAHYRGPKNSAYAIKAEEVLAVEKIPA